MVDCFISISFFYSLSISLYFSWSPRFSFNVTIHNYIKFKKLYISPKCGPKGNATTRIELDT